MSNLQLSGNTDKKLKELDIFGYSGFSLDFPLKDRFPYCFLVQNNNWKVFAFYKPADISHHLPQDSLGVVIKKNEIYFSIADGVSIVNSTHDNQSGQVSLDLVKESLTKKEPDYKFIWNTYKEETLKGASTLQHGRLTPVNIMLDFFGSTDNLGQTYYLNGDGKLINATSDGYDFFPQTLTPKRLLIEKTEFQGIVSTSDGAIFTEQNLSSLIKLVITSSKKDEIQKNLLDCLPNSPDDQSVLVITKFGS